MDTRPALYSAGHALVITAGFYRAALGSAVVMRNLLAQFSPESFTVLTIASPAEASAPISPGIRVITVRTDPPFGMRGERYWRDLIRPLLERSVQKVVKELDPALILAVYPTLHFFSAATRAAEAYGIPWIAYLHDTIVEQFRSTKYERMADDLQRRMFSSSKAILVTGRGMSDLYRARYSVESVAIEIGYCEPIPRMLPERPGGSPHAFMGGSIYAVNDRVVARIVDGAESAGIRFRLASPADWSRLERHGIRRSSGIEKVHYPVRKDYLDALQCQHILTVGLNWPDESLVAADELSTAFPTKAVEYLASGQPILVHCPEHYFLARFFRENDCGVVVSTRDTRIIAKAAKSLLERGQRQDQMCTNALRAAHLFSMDRVSALFKGTLERCCS